MLYRVILPLIFVGLWSSAFVTAKIGVQYATPFAVLMLRFGTVSCLFGLIMLALWRWRRTPPATPERPVIALTALVGLLLHGLYLGSVFFALSRGLSAGISALIVSLQPLLASGLAIILFGEKLRPVQIIGMLAGITGVVLVLLPKLAGAMPMIGLASVTVGLAAVTGGTLLQKKIGGRIDLLASNLIQSLAATAFFLVICATIEPPRIDWQPPFLLALGWLVLMVSMGAYLILMVMIRRDSMAAVSSLMFLVPPVTAIIAAIGFDEPLTLLGILGFCVTSAGVYLVTRYSSPGTP
jgi:drug/metabolite transporter (DMT)-like permease